MQRYPTALQLRYLQTLKEIAAENNSTTIFPVPIDLLKPFMTISEALQKNRDKEINNGKEEGSS